jgi:hypothetical protein
MLTASVNSSGIARILFQPDTGQYWLPTLVHVGVRSNTPVNCDLHSGGIAALNDNTTLKDNTFQGNDDTSSILCGTIISPGEGISCVFTNGQVNDTAFVEIAGLSSDVPPTIGIIPNIPGVRFAGALLAINLPALRDNVHNFSITAGSNTTIGRFDYQPFTSYDVAITALVTGVATDYGGIILRLSWFRANSTGLFDFAYQEDVMFFPDTNGSVTFPNRFGAVGMQDTVHGAFMTVSIFNIGPDPVTIIAQMTGSTRVVGRKYITNVIDNTVAIANPEFGLLADFTQVIGAGGSVTLIIPLSPGPIAMRLATAASSFTFVMIAPNGAGMESWNQAAGTDVHFVSYLPRTAARMVITNTSGVAGTAVLIMSSGRESW